MGCLSVWVLSYDKAHARLHSLREFSPCCKNSNSGLLASVLVFVRSLFCMFPFWHVNMPRWKHAWRRSLINYKRACFRSCASKTDSCICPCKKKALSERPVQKIFEFDTQKTCPPGPDSLIGAVFVVYHSSYLLNILTSIMSNFARSIT